MGEPLALTSTRQYRAELSAGATIRRNGKKKEDENGGECCGRAA